MKYFLLLAMLVIGACGSAASFMSDYQVLFIESPEQWSQSNGDAIYPDEANNFHFAADGDNRVEFESLDGDLYHYIEAGYGRTACYGFQEGATNHWFVCVEPSGDMLFCPDSFGPCADPAMTLHKDGTLEVNSLIINE